MNNTTIIKQRGAIMNRIKELRKHRGLSQKQLADALYVNQTAVSQWERGATTPSKETLIKLANILNTSTDDLLGNKSSVSRIPVVGVVPAGIAIEAIEDILDYEEITPEMAQLGDLFGLRVKGDSMEPRIKEGDVLIIRKQDTAETGDIVIAFVNGDNEATVKKYVRHDEGISLVPYNQAYTPKFFTKNEIEKLPVRIIGKVIELRGKF